LNERFSSGSTPSFTSSAFIQNRKKIDPEVFSHLSGVIIDNFYTPDNEVLNYLNGIRVLAVDSSKLTLPCTAELKKCYGVTKNQSQVEIVQARASVLYDVLNSLTLDAALDNLSKGERELALRHSHRWKNKDLIIYDRGYPSYEFINEHIKRDVDCLIRVTTASFSILRWSVETFYDELKNKLKVEHFTGYSPVSIQQDFFCAIFISNLQSVIVNDLADELALQNQDKKYDYKVNTNLSYGFLKNRVLELLYGQAPLDKIFQELETLFLNHTVPIRNNRTVDRHVGRYRARTRPKVTKNQRDAI